MSNVNCEHRHEKLVAFNLVNNRCHVLLIGVV